MKEFELIEEIRKIIPKPSSSINLGVGDDAAVLKGSSLRQVITTDSQIEGIHFNVDWISLNLLGRRSVEVTLSDLAAMGARPKTVVVALNLTGKYTAKAISLMRGSASRFRGPGVSLWVETLCCIRGRSR